MKRLTFAFSSLLSFCFTSCYKVPTFISSTGSFKLDRATTITVFEAPEDRINYRVALALRTSMPVDQGSQDGIASTEPKDAPMKKGSPWFIYAANSRAIWVYHGDEDGVELIEIVGSGFKRISNAVGNDLLRKAPAEFADRLPPVFKWK